MLASEILHIRTAISALGEGGQENSAVAIGSGVGECIDLTAENSGGLGRGQIRTGDQLGGIGVQCLGLGIQCVLDEVVGGNE